MSEHRRDLGRSEPLPYHSDMAFCPWGFRPCAYPLPSSGLPLQTSHTTFVSAFVGNLSNLFLSAQAEVSVLLGNNTPQGPELRTTSGERVK